MPSRSLVPDGSQFSHPTRNGRAAARVLLAAMSWFIVYGSLFPFDFSATPLPLSSFLEQADLLANRADAIDNVFLFVPFGLALQASFAGTRTRLLGAGLALLVLGLGIQLVQLYLPSRTASLSDVAWNATGLVLGMLLSARLGRLLAAQLKSGDGPRDNFLLILLACWFCYESFPFLPTLDLGMLRAHIRPALLAPPFGLSRMAQHAAAAVLAGMALMEQGWIRRPLRGVLLAGALVLALEIMVPYGALRRETLLGIVLGLAGGAAAHRLGARRSAQLAMALALGMLVFTVLTPYRGQPPQPTFTFVPFSHFLWYSTLGIVPPLAFESLAIAALLWSGLRLGKGPALSWCLLVLILLGVLEVLRVEVAAYRGDTSLLVLALVMAPCAVIWRRGRRASPAPAASFTSL